MKIGIDLRVLQVGHQYRGIGEVAKQCLNHMFELAADDGEHAPSFIFYEYGDDPIDPKQFLRLPPGLQYEEHFVGKRPEIDQNRSRKDKLRAKWRRWLGNPLPQATSCDALLQFDYALGVPRRPKTLLVAHDLIPYIYWKDVFESPWLYFKHRAARTMLRTLYNNAEYLRVLKRSHRAAWRIICVSEHTKRDLRKYLHVPNKKMQVMHLGVDGNRLTAATPSETIGRLPTKPFLLFIGAVDARRRRIDDLVAAYNNLKAHGHDIQLVLVGENFQAPETIPGEVARAAVLESSYKDDILTLGYINDATKRELYKRAVAFVFPTTYEGFGLPVLEAMILDCPVITYQNSSIPEVGGQHVLYANNWTDIQDQTLKLLEMPAAQRKQWLAATKKHAEQFRWDSMAQGIYRELLSR